MDIRAIEHAYRRYARFYDFAFGTVFRSGRKAIKVIAMYVVSVVPDPERLVDEMRRVCKPNGWIIFVYHFHSRNPVPGAFESLLAPLSAQLGFRPDFSLERFLDKSGLHATNIHPVNILHFCAMVEARNNKQFLPEMAAPVCATSW